MAGHFEVDDDDLPEEERRLLAAAARDVMERDRLRLAEPDPEELAAFAAGTLPPADRARLEDAIAADPEAAAAVRDLRAFPEVEPRPGTPRLTAGELESGWSEMRSRLAAEGILAPARSGRPDGPGPLRWFAPVRLAAGFAALALTLGGYVGWLHGTGRVAGPRGGDGVVANPRIVTLISVDDPGERGAATIPAQAGGEATVVVFALSEALPAGSELRLEVRDAAGVLRREVGGLRLQPESDTIHVEFSGESLPEGLLDLRLFAERGGAKEVAAYRLRVEPRT